MFTRKQTFCQLKLIITCEHGGNQIPPIYQTYFKDQEAMLASHRAYDPGTLDLWKEVKGLADFSIKNEISRLLIEFNRSLHHPQLFSQISKKFSIEQKEQLLQQYYFPYRNSVEQQIGEWINLNEKVLHLSLHSFTPILHGDLRNADMGILYDSSILDEKNFCKKFKTQLQQELPEFNIRFNYPYLGKADGLTTYLRKKFPRNYLGIELEINQKYAVDNQFPKYLKTAIVRVIEQLQENKHSVAE